MAKRPPGRQKGKNNRKRPVKNNRKDKSRRPSQRPSAKSAAVPRVEVKLTPWEVLIRGTGYVAVIAILIGILAAIAHAGPLSGRRAPQTAVIAHADRLL